MLDSIDATIYVADMRTFELLFVNQQGIEVFGDFSGKKCWDYFQKDKTGPCSFCTNEILLDKDGNPGEGYVWEFRNTITGRWYQCRDSAIRWTDGRIVRLEIATDITARKNAEEQVGKLCDLKELLLGTHPLEEKMQSITDSAVDIFGVDIAGIWLKKEADICMKGCRYSHQAEGKEFCENRNTCLHLVTSSGIESPHLNTYQRIPMGLSKIGQLGESTELKYLYNTPGSKTSAPHPGSDFLYETTSFAGYRLIAPDGSTAGVLSFFRRQELKPEEERLMEDLANTTSQVLITSLSKKALEESERLYRTLVESIPHKIYRKDLNFLYLGCNNNFLQDLHLKEEDVIGKTDYDLFPRELADAYRKDDTKLLESGSTLEFTERYLVDGMERWITAIKTPIQDSNGSFQSFLGILWDITDKIRAENELKKLYTNLEERVAERTDQLMLTQQAFQLANTKLNLLNSVTRHDILNLITGLSGYLEISKDITSDETLLGYLESAEAAAGGIQRHITFTKLYQDIGVHSPSWQQVQKAVNAAINSFGSTSIRIYGNIDDVEVYADPLLEKVFYTLIENTIRHGSHASVIVFSSIRKDTGLILVYEDNGSGVDPQEKEQIFERGYGKNTGFGLYLAREILAITGLSIRETGVPGKGVRFEILIPSGKYRAFIC